MLCIAQPPTRRSRLFWPGHWCDHATAAACAPWGIPVLGRIEAPVRLRSHGRGFRSAARTRSGAMPAARAPRSRTRRGTARPRMSAGSGGSGQARCRLHQVDGEMQHRLRPHRPGRDRLPTGSPGRGPRHVRRGARWGPAVIRPSRIAQTTPVVRHEGPVRRGCEQEREARLARTRGTANQDPGPAQRDAGAVQGDHQAWSCRGAAGRRTMKRGGRRAPSARRPRRGRRGRFSARIVPRWAWTIWREDRQAEAGILAETPAPAGRCRSARRSAPGRAPGCQVPRPRRSSRPPAHAAQHDPDLRVGRRERAGVIEEIVDHLPEPAVVADDREQARPAPSPSPRRRAGSGNPSGAGARWRPTRRW